MRKLLLTAMLMSIAGAVLAIDGNIICSKTRNIQDQWTGILPGRPPMIPICTQVVKAEPFTVNVFFVNPVVKDGKVKVSGKLTMYAPDGSSKFSTSLKVLEFQCDNPKQVFLFPDFLMVSFDPPDAFGSYSFKAEIKDELDNTDKTTEAKVLLKERCDLPVAPQPLKAMTNYYAAPGPQNIIPAFKEFLAQVPELKEKQGRNFNPLSMLALFHYALAYNPQLWPEFIDCLKTLDGENQKMAILTVSSLGPEFNKLLPDDFKKQLAKFTFQIEKPSVPWNLDVLWSEFLVTGQKAPLMKIAEATILLNGGLTIEKFKEIQNPTDADRQALMSNITGRAAAWSLASNVKQHQLVAYYLECALARNEFKAPFVMMSIGKILSEAPQPNQAPASK